MAWPVLVATSKVWPSGAALAVISAAMVLDAPGLFSTTHVPLMPSANFSASMRAMMSVPPPGPAPTMSFTALVGYGDWAWVGRTTSSRLIKRLVVKVWRFMGLLLGSGFQDRSIAGTLSAAPGDKPGQMH